MKDSRKDLGLNSWFRRNIGRKAETVIAKKSIGQLIRV